eukprot:scaffold128088_cov41-Attheya_sp.AAC.4
MPGSEANSIYLALDYGDTGDMPPRRRVSVFIIAVRDPTRGAATIQNFRGTGAGRLIYLI